MKGDLLKGLTKVLNGWENQHGETAKEARGIRAPTISISNETENGQMGKSLSVLISCLGCTPSQVNR